jgi:hypothetical protein
MISAARIPNLETQRRSRVEKFLHAVGLPPARCTSRNPLEQPWVLPPEDFVRRAARDEAAALYGL